LKDYKALVINEEPKGTFHYTLQKKCDYCEEKIVKYGVYLELLSNSPNIPNEFKIVCGDCRRKYSYRENLFTVVNKKFVVITNVYPPGSIPYNYQSPRFKNSKNLSVFDVADKQQADEVTEDNTVLSGRLQSDYDPQLLEKRDQALLLKDEALNSSNLDVDEELKKLTSSAQPTLLERKERALLDGDKRTLWELELEEHKTKSLESDS
jgi:hypothetical protein